MNTYIFKIIMIPLVIKKQGDDLISYEIGHSLVFWTVFENITMNTYIWEYKCFLITSGIIISLNIYVFIIMLYPFLNYI